MKHSMFIQLFLSTSSRQSPGYIRQQNHVPPEEFKDEHKSRYRRWNEITVNYSTRITLVCT